MRPAAAPCGHDWRSDKISRVLRGVLFPTIWIECRCKECEATWTERYEFDFSIPIDGSAKKQKASTPMSTPADWKR
jgi:hypothetical protein